MRHVLIAASLLATCASVALVGAVFARHERSKEARGTPGGVPGSSRPR